MPRIIAFLLTIAALATLTVQNLAIEVPLVVVGRTFTEAMPFGFLLLSAVGTGALLTLIFYGLVGSRRPPESKYRPMGRRVPYPESPSSNPLPASGPSADDSFGSSVSKGYSSSSAFVSEPKAPAQPFVTPPQDRPVQDTPPSPSTPSPNAPSSEPSSFVQSDFAEPPNTYFAPNEGAYSSSDSTRSDSTRNDPARSDSPSSAPAPGESLRTVGAAASTFVQQPIAGLKSAFGKKKDRKSEPDAPEKPIGDDWGQRRTKEQINSWDTSFDEPSRLEEGAKNLFNFGRNVGANAGRLAEDIVSGWNNQSPDGSGGTRDDNRYVDPQYDGLDQGWENFDDYGEAPSQRERVDKRTYGDSLYGSDEDSRRSDSGYTAEPYAADEPYPDEPYADEIGPEGVYDADYKVIVPPSQPLTDSDDRLDDYP